MKIDTEALLISVNIIDVISGFGVHLKKSGSRFKALCPFHTEKTPSFVVSEEKQAYHCFGCGAGGDSIQFVREYAGMDFIRACEYLAGGREIAVLPEIKKRHAEKRHRFDAWEKGLMQDVAEISGWIISDAKQGPHPYLKEKGFDDYYGMLVSDDYIKTIWTHLRKLQREQFYWKPSAGESLIIPMENIDTRKTTGVQVIRAVDNKWQKKYLPGMGMATVGSVHWLGDRKLPETILVEGYSTGLSVFKALQLMNINVNVCVCFSANNLIPVSKSLGGRIGIFADNDESETGKKSSIKTGRPFVMAEQVGWDANDLHKHKGVISVQAKIMELRGVMASYY